MRQHIAQLEPSLGMPAEIVKTRFGDILRALYRGGVYAFDREAYARFYPLAKIENLDVKEADVDKMEKEGLRFVTVRLADQSS